MEQVNVHGSTQQNSPLSMHERFQEVHGVEGVVLNISKEQDCQESNRLIIKVKNGIYSEFNFQGDLQISNGFNYSRLQKGSQVIRYALPKEPTQAVLLGAIVGHGEEEKTIPVVAKPFPYSSEIETIDNKTFLHYWTE